jgi:hypothetical protein
VLLSPPVFFPLSAFFALLALFSLILVLSDLHVVASARSEAECVPCLHYLHSLQCSLHLCVFLCALGNLRSAVRMDATTYHLSLEFDTNTMGHTQWFFFRVHDMVPGVRYTFAIVNLEKPSSLFNEGMRPLVYLSTASPSITRRTRTSSTTSYPSTTAAASSTAGAAGLTQGGSGKQAPDVDPLKWPPLVPGDGWRRCGEHVCYAPNKYTKVCGNGDLASVPAKGVSVGQCDTDPDTDVDDVSPAVAMDGGVVSETSATSTVVAANATTAESAANLLRQGSVYEHRGASIEYQSLYSESWSVVFPEGTTVAFFAYCQPYTMTDLLFDVKRYVFV